MIHEPGGPNSNCQKTGGLTYDCITLVPKETCQNYNRLEPVGSTSERLKFLLKKICHVRTENKILALSISNTYETDIMQNCNSLDFKYPDIKTKY